MAPILIDGRPLQGGSRYRGIGTYVRSLVAGLRETQYGHQLAFLLDSSGQALDEDDAALAPTWGIHVLATKARLQPLVDPFLMARIVRKARPLLYHSVDYGQPITSSIPVVTTVHDVIPFVFPHWYPWLRRERLFGLQLIRRADAVIAVSKATANDLIRLARVPESLITVIPEGVSSLFQPVPTTIAQPTVERLGIDGPFLLAVGTFDPRKRLGLLLQVTQRIRESVDIQLVIAGHQGKLQEQVEQRIRESGLASATTLLGYVTHNELTSLYSQATCLVFPSEYEGFGLPPLEAMACGCPVAMFANSSLVEVASPKTILVDAFDVRSMSDGILKLVGDVTARHVHRSAGLRHAHKFRWEDTARATADVYTQVLRAHG